MEVTTVKLPNLEPLIEILLISLNLNLKYFKAMRFLSKPFGDTGCHCFQQWHPWPNDSSLAGFLTLIHDRLGGRIRLPPPFLGFS